MPPASQRRLSAADRAHIADEVPAMLPLLDGAILPKRVRHPAGFTLTGAPVGTWVRCALLLAGGKALGRRYGGMTLYEEAERDLAFGIMRSEHGYPKGTFCCAQCTLAVLPVLEAGAIRYFDNRPLAANVRGLIRARKWRFAGAVNPRMKAWALGAR